MAIDKQSKNMSFKPTSEDKPEKLDFFNCPHTKFKMVNSVALPFDATQKYFLCNFCHHQWQEIEEDPARLKGK